MLLKLCQRNAFPLIKILCPVWSSRVKYGEMTGKHIADGCLYGTNNMQPLGFYIIVVMPLRTMLRIIFAIV